jgi:glycosyltransferase involved in cell wall biosynthesis
LDDLQPRHSDLPAIDSIRTGPPLSVAFVSPGWPPDGFANGVIPYIDKIAGELRRQGHRATILANYVIGEVDGLKVRDVRPARVPGNPLIRRVDQLVYRLSTDMGLRRQFVRSVVKECRRLIDEQGLQLLEMEEAFGMAYWVRKELPIPVIVRLHGPWFLNGPQQGKADDAEFRAKVRAERRAIAAADSITSPSLDVLERTRAYYGLALEGALVIPPPTAMVPEAHRWRPDGGDPNLVLFVGRFDLHKGGDLIIKAFAEVARRRPGARLRFVGPDRGVMVEGDQRLGIEAYIRREAPAAADRIEYLGQLPSGELGRLRREARVSVVCSRYETFGLTLTEAITTGCPTVATRAGAFLEIIQDGVNGLFCAPEDPLDLAEKICALLGDEDLATRLSRRAALDGERRFEAGSLALELSDHYRKVIEAGRRPGRGVPPR